MSQTDLDGQKYVQNVRQVTFNEDGEIKGQGTDLPLESTQVFDSTAADVAAYANAALQFTKADWAGGDDKSYYIDRYGVALISATPQYQTIWDGLVVVVLNGTDSEIIHIAQINEREYPSLPANVGRTAWNTVAFFDIPRIKLPFNKILEIQIHNFTITTITSWEATAWGVVL